MLYLSNFSTQPKTKVTGVVRVYSSSLPNAALGIDLLAEAIGRRELDASLSAASAASIHSE